MSQNLLCIKVLALPLQTVNIRPLVVATVLAGLAGGRAALGRQVLTYVQAAPGAPAGCHHWAPGHGRLDPRRTHHTGGPQPGKRHSDFNSLRMVGRTAPELFLGHDGSQLLLGVAHNSGQMLDASFRIVPALGG